MFKFALGETVKCKITGYVGVVTSRTEYLTGCLQYGVQSKILTKEGKIAEVLWFDESRIEVVDKKVDMSIKVKGGPSPHPYREQM